MPKTPRGRTYEVKPTPWPLTERVLLANGKEGTTYLGRVSRYGFKWYPLDRDGDIVILGGHHTKGETIDWMVTEAKED